MWKRFVFLFLACLYSVGCFGCFHKSPSQMTYALLESSAVVYSESLTVAGDMYQKGDISESQKIAVVLLAKQFRSAYMFVVEAYYDYELLKNPANEDRLQKAIASMIRLKDQLIETITLYSSTTGD